MFAISPTDLNWFQQLRTEGLQGNVINFWTPTPWNISRLKSGDNLLVGAAVVIPSMKENKNVS